MKKMTPYSKSGPFRYKKLLGGKKEFNMVTDWSKIKAPKCNPHPREKLTGGK